MEPNRPELYLIGNGPPAPNGSCVDGLPEYVILEAVKQVEPGDGFAARFCGRMA